MTIMDDVTGDQVTSTPSGPAPLLDGTFSIYSYEGGLLLAWKKRGHEKTNHMPIPKFVFQLAAQQAGKTPDEMIIELTRLGSED